MRKLSVGLAVIGLAAILSKSAHANCVCACINGQFAAACSNPLDIPPICALRTCPFSLTPKTPPLGGRSSCAQQKACDIYGHCEWKFVCK